MIPKSGYRFSDKIMLKQNTMPPHFLSDFAGAAAAGAPPAAGAAPGAAPGATPAPAGTSRTSATTI